MEVGPRPTYNPGGWRSADDTRQRPWFNPSAISVWAYWARLTNMLLDAHARWLHFDRRWASTTIRLPFFGHNVGAIAHEVGRDTAPWKELAVPGAAPDAELLVQHQLSMPQKWRKGAKGTKGMAKSGSDMLVSSAKGDQKANMKVMYDDVKINNMDVEGPVMANTMPINDSDHLLVEGPDMQQHQGLAHAIADTVADDNADAIAVASAGGWSSFMTESESGFLKLEELAICSTVSVQQGVIVAIQSASSFLSQVELVTLDQLHLTMNAMSVSICVQIGQLTELSSDDAAALTDAIAASSFDDESQRALATSVGARLPSPTSSPPTRSTGRAMASIPTRRTSSG